MSFMTFKGSVLVPLLFRTAFLELGPSETDQNWLVVFGGSRAAQALRGLDGAAPDSVGAVACRFSARLAPRWLVPIADQHPGTLTHEVDRTLRRGSKVRR